METRNWCEDCVKNKQNWLSLSFCYHSFSYDASGCLSSIFTITVVCMCVCRECASISRWACKSNGCDEMNMKPQLRKRSNSENRKRKCFIYFAGVCVSYICTFAIGRCLRCVCSIAFFGFGVSCLHFSHRLLNIPECLHSPLRWISTATPTGRRRFFSISFFLFRLLALNRTSAWFDELQTLDFQHIYICRASCSYMIASGIATPKGAHTNCKRWNKLTTFLLALFDRLRLPISFSLFSPLHNMSHMYIVYKYKHAHTQRTQNTPYLQLSIDSSVSVKWKYFHILFPRSNIFRVSHIIWKILADFECENMIDSNEVGAFFPYKFPKKVNSVNCNRFNRPKLNVNSVSFVWHGLLVLPSLNTLSLFWRMGRIGSETIDRKFTSH